MLGYLLKQIERKLFLNEILQCKIYLYMCSIFIFKIVFSIVLNFTLITEENSWSEKEECSTEPRF